MHQLIRTTSLSAALLLVGLAPHSAAAAAPTTPDCLAASEASFKLGSQQQLRSERSQLLVCAASSCPADIRHECLQRVEAVNRSIPTIIFEVKAADGKALSAAKLSMDGEVLAERLEGAALSIDPGEHTFRFEVTGQPPLEKHLLILEAQKDRRESVTIPAPKPAVETPLPAAQSVHVGSSGVTPLDSKTQSRLGSQRVAALISGSVGVVGVGLGSVFGLIAISKKNDAHAACPNQCADQSGVDKWQEARSTARLSDVFFAVGGVGLVGAATLWFTAHPHAETEPKAQVGLGPGEIRLKGTW